MTTKEFNTCADDFADGLYRFVLKNLKDPDTASDIVQDVFEKVWTSVSDIEFVNVKSYMYTAAYHAMLNQIRENNRLVTLDETTSDIQTEGEQYKGISDVLDQALKRLPMEKRIAILLIDYEGYDYERIGQIMGLDTETVRRHVYSARRRMKEYLVKFENVM
jgi:RNA polymerase sigma factor (sigma-70 family)